MGASNGESELQKARRYAVLREVTPKPRSAGKSSSALASTSDRRPRSLGALQSSLVVTSSTDVVTLLHKLLAYKPVSRENLTAMGQSSLDPGVSHSRGLALY